MSPDELLGGELGAWRRRLCLALDAGAPAGVIWQPTPEFVEGSHIRRLMATHGTDDFYDLHRRSVEDPAWFWDAVVRDLDYQFYTPYTQVMDTSRGIPFTRWFVDGQVNVAHNCLDKHVLTHRRNKLAVIWEGEDGAVRKLSYWELWGEANRLAHGLRSLGVGKGDRVGIFLPMLPETVAAVLACAKLGAIFTPIFSGYAAPAAAARLADCGARVLITADGFWRRGVHVPMKQTADEAAAAAPGVEKVVVVQRLGVEVPWSEGRDIWYHDLVAGQPRLFETERTSAEDPLMIIYTSGTTGRPKGAIHVHAGFPLKATQDMAHCFDVRESDIMFWLTDLGWMMGPWEIYGTLALGSTMVAYEGAIDYPAPDRLWSLVAGHGITVLGVSPTVVRALMPHGEEWVHRHDLSTLRILGSTGEPWNAAPYLWYFEQVGGGRCPIINYSGGTEISGGIVCCTPIRPLKVAGFSIAIPGMDVDVVDDEGRPVPPGTVGELVIYKPWPGMTRSFWQDDERYLSTYWSRFKDVWVHGDWASVDQDGFWYIHGRSDDTIKIAGKRIGPAEIESALVSHPAVAEAAAIGVPHPVKGEVVVAFAVLRPEHGPSEELRRELKEVAAAQLGKALQPDTIKFVRALPKTRNAKVMRRVIKARFLGHEPGDISSLENPEAVAEIDRAQ